MKKLKKFLILCLLPFLSGCSVEYNLVINEDNTVNENVIATENTNRMESSTRLKGKQAVIYLYDMFKRDDENIVFSYKEDGDNTVADASLIYDSIDDYAISFSSDVFDNVKIEKSNGVVTFYSQQSKALGGDSGYSLIYDSIVVNIEIPYKVISNNADSVDDNVYTWKINKNQDLKTIEFSYEEGNKQDEINITINDKTYDINYILIFGICFVLVIALIILIVCIKNKKNNVV